MTRCEQIQQMLIEQGHTALSGDMSLQQHIDNCPECEKLQQSLGALEFDLNSFTELDAPDSLIAKTLQAVEQSDPSIPAASNFERYRLRWASGFASVFVVVSVLGLWQSGLREMILQRDYLTDPFSSTSSVPASDDDLLSEYEQSHATDGNTDIGQSREQNAADYPDSVDLVMQSPATISEVVSDRRDAEIDAQLGANQQAAIAESKALMPTATQPGRRSATTENRRKRELDARAQNEFGRQSEQTAQERNAPADSTEAFRQYSSSQPEPAAAPPTLTAADELQFAGGFSDAEATADQLPSLRAESKRVDVTGSRLSQVNIEGAKPATSIDRSDKALQDIPELRSNDKDRQQAYKEDLREQLPNSQALPPDELKVLAEHISEGRLRTEEQNPGDNPARELVRVAVTGAGPSPEEIAEYEAEEKRQRNQQALDYHLVGQSGKSEPETIEKTAPQKPVDPNAEARFANKQQHAATGSDEADQLPDQALREQHLPDQAQQFLNQLDSLDDLTYQSASGYWANNYVPGDPVVAFLQSQLEQIKATVSIDHAHFEQLAQPIREPFDIPDNAALATYLHSDKTHIDGPTRLRLQVGLQTSEHHGGQRPAMNVAVVVDLHDTVSTQFSTETRALLNALQAAKQTGDRFSLTVAGQSGGVLIPAGQFRHGSLAVAVNQMFGDTDPASTAALSLPQAITAAGQNLMNDINTDNVLGTNLILLITATTWHEYEEFLLLEQMAHQNAVNGLLLSAISLGSKADIGLINALVLAGQGQRRSLPNADAAKRMIEEELYTASRAVARAVRVRIQLAPGVKLVKVHGSRRLDTTQTERVKQAENSIDQRLSDNLGISTDRGEDEAGIQIVIPTMPAGSRHVILLDVVAEQPGPIADVQVRYKDLIHLRNSVAQAQLNLGEQPRNAGKLELNVIKNLLALQFAETLSNASQSLAKHDIAAAKAQLSNAVELLSGLRQHVPDLKEDAELIRDEQLLAEYQRVLNLDDINKYPNEWYLSTSLKLAAFQKLNVVTD